MTSVPGGGLKVFSRERRVGACGSFDSRTVGGEQERGAALKQIGGAVGTCAVAFVSDSTHSAGRL